METNEQEIVIKPEVIAMPEPAVDPGLIALGNLPVTKQEPGHVKIETGGHDASNPLALPINASSQNGLSDRDTSCRVEQEHFNSQTDTENDILGVEWELAGSASKTRPSKPPTLRSVFIPTGLFVRPVEVLEGIPVNKQMPTGDVLHETLTKTGAEATNAISDTRKHAEIKRGTRVLKLDRIVHQVESVDLEWYKCGICNCRTFRGRACLEQHINTVHKAPKPFGCDFCPRKYSTKIEAARHARNAHGNEFHCQSCRQSFPGENQLKKHVLSVHGSLICVDCSETFFSRDHLDEHVKTVHSGLRSYRCEVCAEVFSRQSRLLQHIKRIHENPLPHECPDCGRRFQTSRRLNNHRRRVDKCVAICHLCNGRVFACKQSLDSHIRSQHSVNNAVDNV